MKLNKFILLLLICSISFCSPIDFAQKQKTTIKPTQTTKKVTKPVVQKKVTPVDLIKFEETDESSGDFSDYYNKQKSALKLLSDAIILGQLTDTIYSDREEIPFIIDVIEPVYDNFGNLVIDKGDRIVGTPVLKKNYNDYQLVLKPTKIIFKQKNIEKQLSNAIAIPMDSNSNEKYNNLKKEGSGFDQAMLSDIWDIAGLNTNTRTESVAKTVLNINGNSSPPLITVAKNSLLLIKINEVIEL